MTNGPVCFRRTPAAMGQGMFGWAAPRIPQMYKSQERRGTSARPSSARNSPSGKSPSRGPKIGQFCSHQPTAERPGCRAQRNDTDDGQREKFGHYLAEACAFEVNAMRNVDRVAEGIDESEILQS